MERYFKDQQHIKNKTLHLAEKAELGLGTIQRTLSCETGASIDTIEALAKVFGIRPYEMLKPSKAMQTMLSVEGGYAMEDPEELQRQPSRGPTRRS